MSSLLQTTEILTHVCGLGTLFRCSDNRGWRGLSSNQNNTRADGVCGLALVPFSLDQTQFVAEKAPGIHKRGLIAL